MAKQERILIVDNSPYSVFSLKEALEAGEHTVVETIYSRNKLAEYLNDNDHVFTVAFVDSRFPKEADGEAAAALIRETRPRATIVSFSLDPRPWGDFLLQKGASLSEILAKVEAIQPKT